MHFNWYVRNYTKERCIATYACLAFSSSFIPWR